MKSVLAEFIGTFGLVFIGTGSIIVNDIFQGTITHFGISFAFGAAVMILIYVFGDISGAHFNPAVTLGFSLAKRFSFKRVPLYVIAQSLGAVLASLFLKFLFPFHATLGATIPTYPLFRSFLIELLATVFLILVILNVTVGEKEKKALAGVAIGASVGVMALVGGPISGASMNPVRSLGPALISGHYLGIWIYILAPMGAAFIAARLHRLFNNHPHD